MVPALLLAAAVLARASTRAGARLGVLAWLATVAAMLGAVALALASRSVDPQPLQLVLLPWAGSVFDSSVALSAQPLTLARRASSVVAPMTSSSRAAEEAASL